jgi:hypothetical protein
MATKKLNETDDFMNRFQASIKYAEDFQTIVYFLKVISDNGALERYLRPEAAARALPIKSNKLRLYCIRVNDNILILGNGDIKTAKKVKNCPKCYPHFTLANNIQKIIRNSIKNNSTRINKNRLEGQLNFQLK